ncbi:MAG: hypothetical protein ACWGMZ_00665 [Thermoguttaceae bacterium]
MKNWDLTTGMKKMSLAMDSLQASALDTRQYWSDEVNRKFQETYLAPLEPKMRSLLDAIQRLDETLSSAERQCGIS